MVGVHGYCGVPGAECFYVGTDDSDVRGASAILCFAGWMLLVDGAESGVV